MSSAVLGVVLERLGVDPLEDRHEVLGRRRLRVRSSCRGVRQRDVGADVEDHERDLVGHVRGGAEAETVAVHDHGGTEALLHAAAVGDEGPGRAAPEREPGNTDTRPVDARRVLPGEDSVEHEAHVRRLLRDVGAPAQRSVGRAGVGDGEAWRRDGEAGLRPVLEQLGELAGVAVVPVREQDQRTGTAAGRQVELGREPARRRTADRDRVDRGSGRVLERELHVDELTGGRREPTVGGGGRGPVGARRARRARCGAEREQDEHHGDAGTDHARHRATDARAAVVLLAVSPRGLACAPAADRETVRGRHVRSESQDPRLTHAGTRPRPRAARAHRVPRRERRERGGLPPGARVRAARGAAPVARDGVHRVERLPGGAVERDPGPQLRAGQHRSRRTRTARRRWAVRSGSRTC